MIAELLGMRVRTSPLVPSEGWARKANAAEIERANLDALTHGGSLIDCERPASFGAVVFMFGGDFLAHPKNAAKPIGLSTPTRGKP